MLVRLGREMGRLLYALLFIVLGAAIGKSYQYTAVAYLGPRIGFAWASLVGLTPFVATMLIFKFRCPRYFSFRAARR